MTFDTLLASKALALGESLPMNGKFLSDRQVPNDCPLCQSRRDLGQVSRRYEGRD